MDPGTDFLGIGWAFPPTFSPIDYRVEMVRDDRDVHQSLRILMATRLGERVMVPDFGTELDALVFQALTANLMARIKKTVALAILNYEPRIDVESIDVDPDPKEPARVMIDVAYKIRETNVRSNMVYPFYLQQATIPPSSP